MQVEKFDKLVELTSTENIRFLLDSESFPPTAVTVLELLMVIAPKDAEAIKCNIV